MRPTVPLAATAVPLVTSYVLPLDSLNRDVPPPLPELIDPEVTPHAAASALILKPKSSYTRLLETRSPRVSLVMLM